MNASPTGPLMIENKGGEDSSVEEYRGLAQSQTGLLALPESGSSERLAAERNLVRKLDRRVLPTIFVIYIMNYIDRNAIPTARLKGFQQDLQISDVQFATVIAILYVSYCPAQIPSNMLLNWVSRPSLYIGACVVLWGMTSLLTGVTKNFAGVIACRIFIGLPEAAFYPGAIYLLSRWYTKKELAFRSAVLYAGFLFSNAFGALIAAGILSKMEGKRGIRAWRWLFFIEAYHMQSLPAPYTDLSFSGVHHYSRWIFHYVVASGLSLQHALDESRLAQARLSEDAGEADQDNAEDSPLEGLKMAIKDPLILIFSLLMMSQVFGLSFVQFFPTLTQTLGFSTTITLLVAAPPWIFAAIVCCLNAWHADKTGERFFHIVAWWWGVILGFIIALSTMSLAGRYVSLFLMASGYSGFAITLVWVSNTIPRPPSKRAAAIGIVMGLGNLGNLIGSYTWKAAWGPRYHQSMVILLAGLAFSSVLSFVIRQMLIRKNQQLDADEKAAMEGADRTRVEEAARLEGLTLEQALERRKGYRFLY